MNTEFAIARMHFARFCTKCVSTNYNTEYTNRSSGSPLISLISEDLEYLWARTLKSCDIQADSG